MPASIDCNQQYGHRAGMISSQFINQMQNPASPGRNVEKHGPN
ncbi:hypothetical protein [Hoeflea sp. IMCC20628]|nr:hypothetical protein [Hoeflea sp. IMCC20628]